MVCSIAIVAMALGGSRVMAGQDTQESWTSLQEKCIAAAAKAKRSMVRVVWRHHDHDDTASGVIFTADGYVATFLYMSYRAPHSRYSTRMPTGESVTVYLADGRRVPGVVVGTFSSAKELEFDLVKITEKGAWPCAEIGRDEARRPGETCLALGFPRGPGGTREREPSVRIGHLIPWGVLGMLRSSCVICGLDDRGGGLFDLEGRLIGIHLVQPYSSYETRSGPTACHLDIKVVEQNWRRLANQKPSAEKARAEALPDEALPPVPSTDAPELAAVVKKVREATVALTWRKAPFGCSGTIVTPDGYIATCAHHQEARGTTTTVYFADGRTATATFLGRDDILDIGLAKITAPGPWPCVAMGCATDVKVGSACLIAGYPNYLRKAGKVPLVVRGARVVDTRYVPTELLSVCQVWDGDSGGGLFDDQGRLVGVLSGWATPKMPTHSVVDGFAALWDQLAKGPALGDPVPFEASPAAAAMCERIKNVPPLVCEVLGDGKRRALGTIVSPDGFVLTKASELYGRLSCRMADGSLLPAVVRHVAREHDLALLKIEATGLPQIVWSSRPEVPVGTLVTALKAGEPPTVGVVSYPTHEVPPAAGYLGIGKVKDAEGGVEVEQLTSWWKPVIVEGLQKNHGLLEFESPIRVGDIITRIEGRPVPNAKALEKLAKLRTDGQGWDVPFVLGGDPIFVSVRRDGKDLNLGFPLLSTQWDVRDKTSPRGGSFPAVFDTDVRLAKDMCGGPMVDGEGKVVGIVIALPVSDVMQSSVMPRVFVVPTAVARAVATQRR
jgi:S1-C subfamily serine protease